MYNSICDRVSKNDGDKYSLCIFNRLDRYLPQNQSGFVIIIKRVSVMCPQRSIKLQLRVLHSIKNVH